MCIRDRFIADTTNSKIGIGQVPNGAGNVLQVTGGINISTGGLSTSGTSRLDGSGNLTNIGNSVSYTHLDVYKRQPLEGLCLLIYSTTSIC